MKKIFLLFLFPPFIINAQTAFISNVSGAQQLSICSNQEDSVKVSFSNGTAPYSFVYAINGVSQTAISETLNNPFYIKVKTAGTYTLTYFSDFSSTSNVINGSVKVVVMNKPTAIFSTDSDTMSIINTTLRLQDISIPVANTYIVSWYWDFGDGNTSYQQNPYHSYVYQEDTSIYQISLIVADYNGCSDTAIHHVWIKDEYWMYIPNAFTPNLDEKNRNEKFCLEYHSIRENSFLFKVFNKQGELVFQSTDALGLSCSAIDGGWDGTYFRTQEKLSSGIYSYSLFFQEIEGWKHNKYGTISLIR